MRVRAIAVCALLPLATMACAQKNETSATSSPGDISLTIGSVPKSVEGNVVMIPVTVKGITIVKPDGDTSGKTGHFHVWIDAQPPVAGTAMPKKRGVVHSPDNPIPVRGLSPGKHTLTVVVGNGSHERIGTAEDSVKVAVKGPSVWGEAPATIDKGDDLTLKLHYEGAEGDHMSSNDMAHMSGHFHVLVDPMTPPKAGETLPDEKEGSVYHTAKSTLTISGLKTGEHVIWIVHGNDEHVADDPAVMDVVKVTVS